MRLPEHQLSLMCQIAQSITAASGQLRCQNALATSTMSMICCCVLVLTTLLMQDVISKSVCVVFAGSDG